MSTEIKVFCASTGTIPTQATPGSAGWDLYASQDMVIKPHSFGKVGTGVFLALPPGWEAQVRSRSGLAARMGVFVLNAPGTIDSDYRGEVIVILGNVGGEAMWITKGERVAQLVFSQVPAVSLVDITQDELLGNTTERGDGGLGSTGA